MNRPLYLARLTTVIEKFFGLEPADTTSLWRELLREHSVQYWVTAIDSCTMGTFKALVEGVFPPTHEQLLQLEYQQTDKPGVYLSVHGYCARYPRLRLDVDERQSLCPHHSRGRQ